MTKITISIWSTPDCIYLTRTGPRSGQRHICIGPPTRENQEHLIKMLQELKLHPSNTNIEVKMNQTLNKTISMQRRQMADWCDSQATLHGLDTLTGQDYAKTATIWREAAERSDQGDIAPIGAS